MKIYVAGKLNAEAPGYIQNCHAMIKQADEIRRLGFSVFVPCLDFLMGIVMGNYEYRDYFLNNLSWLKSSDALFVCRNSESSWGTQNEIEIAESLRIPVFRDVEKMKEYFENDRQTN
jgi:hypothetical protein